MTEEVIKELLEIALKTGDKAMEKRVLARAKEEAKA